LPYQRRGVLWRHGVRRREARAAAQLVEPDGRRRAGAAAMFGALLRSRSPWLRLAARAGLMPGVRLVAAAVYRTIAAHRLAASRLQARVGRLLGASAPRRAPWVALSRPGLALRGLGAIYVAAFTSLRVQLLGLYGERGILPVRRYLQHIRERSDDPRHPARARLARLRAVPSLLWLDPSDAGLVRLCTLGQAAGAALAAGLAPRLAAAVAWGAYLSFVAVGRDFLRFQWDVLLLEAGLQATLPRWRRLLMRALAVRLQLESELSKLASRDPTWRDLSACCYHQATQPLPTPAGWYAHHLPRRVQQLATALTLLVESALPPLALGPRRLRQAAFATLTGFQALIAATGNYAFLNALTAILNLTLVERPAPARPSRSERRPAARLVGALGGVAAAVVLALGVSELAQRLRPRGRRSRILARLARALAPLRVVSSYGLFSVMTTRRPEIVIEGSDDGRAWHEYGFRYKPGDPMRAPRWVAPHQPRLDWQMWFAALGGPPAWFASFLQRVLEGSPAVLALLGHQPLPGRAAAVRAGAPVPLPGGGSRHAPPHRRLVGADAGRPLLPRQHAGRRRRARARGPLMASHEFREHSGGVARGAARRHAGGAAGPLGVVKG
jgi:hypothetical protein